jgi:hypothetical protein
MTVTLHIRKFANAFSKSTKPHPVVGEVPIVGGAVLDAVEGYKKNMVAFGSVGLWK